MSDRRLFLIRVGYGDGKMRWIEKIHPESGASGECSLTEKRENALLLTAAEAFVILNVWRATDRCGSARVEMLIR